MSRIPALLHNRTFLTLFFLFLAGVALRFLYFPENIYFGYDQARDAFISKELLGGHFKIVGPPTSIPGLNHGALFYYLFAPIYFISQFDPTGLSVFLRIYNALGIFLIFFIAKYLFEEKSSSRGLWIGFISALLFAFSYEQTQYALFMTHPALAVITVLAFYLGLVMLLFKKNVYGLPLSLLGLGLSFQFHFLLMYLGLIFVLMMGVFWRRIPKLNIKIIAVSALCFLSTISTFIVAEIKFGFSGVKNLVGQSGAYSQGVSDIPPGGFGGALRAAERYVEDNIFFHQDFSLVLLIVFLCGAIYFLKSKQERDKITFLLIWFIVGLFSYYARDTSLYFYGIGTSISLLIMAAFFISQIFQKVKMAAIVILLIIVSSNLYLIIQNNRIGPNKEINVQTGMVLGAQKRAIDYIYSEADGDEFAVNAFSMPLYINTTWAYLFEWYGKNKYGYVPVWGGNTAAGYQGNLVINNSRTTLPEKRFLIIEPIRGIEDKQESFIIEEGWFTDIIEEKKFGDIIVDFQKPK